MTLRAFSISTGLAASTVTPGSTAPVVSFTTPAIAPAVVDCANTSAAGRINSPLRTPVNNALIRFPLVFRHRAGDAIETSLRRAKMFNARVNSVRRRDGVLGGRARFGWGITRGRSSRAGRAFDATRRATPSPLRPALRDWRVLRRGAFSASSSIHISHEAADSPVRTVPMLQLETHGPHTFRSAIMPLRTSPSLDAGKKTHTPLTGCPPRKVPPEAGLWSQDIRASCLALQRIKR